MQIRPNDTLKCGDLNRYGGFHDVPTPPKEMT